MTEPGGQEIITDSNSLVSASEQPAPHIFPNTQHRLEEEHRIAVKSQMQRPAGPLPPLNEAPIIPNTEHRRQAEETIRIPARSPRIIKAA